MVNEVCIWVEGATDLKFLGDVISYWFQLPQMKLNKEKTSLASDTIKVRMPEIKGGHTYFSTKKGFDKIKTDFFQNEISGVLNLVIADSDNNFEQRLTDIKETLSEVEFNIGEHLFLWPYNTPFEGQGDIEVVLEQIVQDEHKGVFACFEQYQSCLKSQNKNYQTPNLKAKIYSYAQTVSGFGNERDRDYTHQNHWNLNPEQPALKPLYHFLKQHIAQ
jgi:hypothetical protein